MLCDIDFKYDTSIKENLVRIRKVRQVVQQKLSLKWALNQ